MRSVSALPKIIFAIPAAMLLTGSLLQAQETPVLTIDSLFLTGAYDRALALLPGVPASGRDAYADVRDRLAELAAAPDTLLARLASRIPEGGARFSLLRAGPVASAAWERCAAIGEGNPRRKMEEYTVALCYRGLHVSREQSDFRDSLASARELIQRREFARAGAILAQLEGLRRDDPSFRFLVDTVSEVSAHLQREVARSYVPLPAPSAWGPRRLLAVRFFAGVNNLSGMVLDRVVVAGPLPVGNPPIEPASGEMNLDGLEPEIGFHLGGEVTSGIITGIDVWLSFQHGTAVVKDPERLSSYRLSRSIVATGAELPKWLSPESRLSLRAGVGWDMKTTTAFTTTFDPYYQRGLEQDQTNFLILIGVGFEWGPAGSDGIMLSLGGTLSGSPEDQVRFGSGWEHSFSIGIIIPLFVRQNS